MNEARQAAPFIDRKLELHLMGDWGLANLHRICGWLASQVMAHSAAGTRVAIWSTTTGGVESVEAVAAGAALSTSCTSYLCKFLAVL